MLKALARRHTDEFVTILADLLTEAGIEFSEDNLQVTVERLSR